MTDSRETMRRRAFRDQARTAQGAETSLAELCIVQGCLRLRINANLCWLHDKETAP